MPIVYVSEPGARVHKAQGRLVIRKGETVLESVPLEQVERLVVMGRGVSVTTAILFALALRGVEVVFLSSRGSYISRVVGAEHKHSRLRHRQALVVEDAARALAVSRAIVAGKLHNQRVLVQRHAEGAPWAAAALEQMKALARRVPEAPDLDALRGLEGRAAALYFALFRRLLRPPDDGGSWGFRRRAYRPPPDPINALLSLGYTYLLYEVIAACQLAGLDPYQGFFHTLDYGKPSLALDLMEEFRPLIADSLVLYAVNRRVIRRRDFRVRRPAAPDANGRPLPVTLTREAHKRFAALYESRLLQQVFYPPLGERTTYRRVMHLQAQHMARYILGRDAEYRPFTVR